MKRNCYAVEWLGFRLAFWNFGFSFHKIPKLTALDGGLHWVKRIEKNQSLRYNNSSK